MIIAEHIDPNPRQAMTTPLSTSGYPPWFCKNGGTRTRLPNRKTPNRTRSTIPDM